MKIKKRLNLVIRKINIFFNFIFPIECLFCKEEGTFVCKKCFKKLEFNTNNFCLCCKKKTVWGEFCISCKNQYYLDGILFATNYEDKKISNLIKKFKYNFVKEIGKDLAKFLYLYWKNFINSNIFQQKTNFINLKKGLIIPIPLHKKRYNWRGFNQAQILAEEFSKKTKFPINYQLIRTKYKKAQAKFNRQNRQENIKNCFSWLTLIDKEHPILPKFKNNLFDQKNTLNNLKNYEIILIDDVATTGATLNEAAKILKNNGAKKVWGLVVAHG